MSLAQRMMMLSGGVAPFDPATLALSVYLDGSKYSAGTWTGTASAGTSGTHNATTVGADPTVGATLNGIATVAFASAGAQRLSLSATLSTYATVAAFSSWALVNMISESVDGADYTVSDDIFSDTGGYFAIGVKPTGPLFGTTIYTGAGNTEVTFANATWQLLQCRYNGTSSQVRVNSGSWTSVASTNIADATNTCLLGSNYNHSRTLNGSIASFGMAASSFDDATFENIRKGLNARFALSL